MGVTSKASQSPHTKDKTKTNFIKQLLELRPGEHLRLDLEDCPIPDFHTSDTVYEVSKTIVKTSKNGEESYYNIYLQSDHAQSMGDPVFQITVARNVPNKIGQTRPDGKWHKYWLNARTGKKRFGNIRWKQLHSNPNDITIVAEPDCCPECGQSF